MFLTQSDFIICIYCLLADKITVSYKRQDQVVSTCLGWQCESLQHCLFYERHVAGRQQELIQYHSSFLLMPWHQMLETNHGAAIVFCLLPLLKSSSLFIITDMYPIYSPFIENKKLVVFIFLMLSFLPSSLQWSLPQWSLLPLSAHVQRKLKFRSEVTDAVSLGELWSNIPPLLLQSRVPSRSLLPEVITAQSMMSTPWTVSSTLDVTRDTHRLGTRQSSALLAESGYRQDTRPGVREMI